MSAGCAAGDGLGAGGGVQAGAAALAARRAARRLEAAKPPSDPTTTFPDFAAPEAAAGFAAAEAASADEVRIGSPGLLISWASGTATGFEGAAAFPSSRLPEPVNAQSHGWLRSSQKSHRVVKNYRY